MNVNKQLIFQTIVTTIYLLLTILFFIGWNQIMYKNTHPNLIISIATAIYFAGGSLIIPVSWFAFLFYRQYKHKSSKPQQIDYKHCLNDSFFAVACFLNLIISAIFMNLSDAKTDFIPIYYIHFLFFVLLLFVIVFMIYYAAAKKVKTKSLIVFLTVLCCLSVIWFMDMLISVDFEEARSFNERFLYFLTYRHTYNFIIVFGILFLFSCLILYFNISNRLKYTVMLLNNTMLVIIIYNFIYMISLFNYLNRINN